MEAATQASVYPSAVDNKLLDEAWANSARTTAEYMLGCIEERMRTYGKQIINYRMGLTQPAEMFYRFLSDIISEENILQHRIGFDYTTGALTVFTVIPQALDDKLPQICKAASDLEPYLYRVVKCECRFWVTTDVSLDQELIGYDFPCFRKGT